MIRTLVVAAAFATLGACVATPPPRGQVLLYVDTDAPVPPGPGQSLGADDPQPLFDSLRIEIFEPGRAEPCANCSHTFILDSTLLRDQRMSIGIVMRPGASGYRARLRLYPSSATLSREAPAPNPDGTLPSSVVDVVVSLPAIGEDGVVSRSIFLPTDSVGLPLGSLDAPVDTTSGRPPTSLVGTWPGARRVPCSGAPREGEVCVAGGAFWMGNASAHGEFPFNAADRLRLVVQSPFFVDSTEVTVGRVRAAGMVPEGMWSGSTTGNAYEDFCDFTAAAGTNEDLPVNCISWTKARAFCRSKGADLPTEAQFEYAAGATKSKLFVWGNEAPAPAPLGCSDAVLERGGWGTIGRLRPQGCKPSTPPGGPLAVGSAVRRDRLVLAGGTIFDLVGNVSELTLDAWNRQDEPCWSGGGVFVDPLCADGLWNGKPSNQVHAARGGSWFDLAESATSAWREAAESTSGYAFQVGFRCARAHERVEVVYGHSPTTLYKLDPKTNGLSTIGDFDCAQQVIDLAIDANDNAFITSFNGFYSLDLKTAKCKMIAQGMYPNALSFVPAATLDPNVEALVGYFGATYARIDPQNGAITNVGSLSGGYTSSGDIVSVKNGGAFLTVKGPGCNDCLLQVDPKTGDLVQNYGPLGYADVFGIAYWGGTVYGFTDAGQLFHVTSQNNTIQTTLIPDAPGLQFYGAGSSTSNLTTGSGAIPIK